MGGSITYSGGSITFRDNIYWVTKYQSPLLVTEKRALDGTIVQSWLSAQAMQIDELHVFRFTWDTQANLEKVRQIIRARASFSMKVRADADTLAVCRFSNSGKPFDYKPIVPEEFFTHEAVAAGALDKYNGELSIIVRR